MLPWLRTLRLEALLFILVIRIFFVFRFPFSRLYESKMHSGSFPQITHSHLSPISTGRLQQLTRCHELFGCLVLGVPLLSSWWTATLIWSKATFVTWIGVPPSQVGMLSVSNLKVQLPDNRCRPLRLSVRLLGLDS